MIHKGTQVLKKSHHLLPRLLLSPLLCVRLHAALLLWTFVVVIICRTTAMLPIINIPSISILFKVVVVEMKKKSRRRWGGGTKRSSICFLCGSDPRPSINLREQKLWGKRSPPPRVNHLHKMILNVDGNGNFEPRHDDVLIPPPPLLLFG